VEYHKVKGFRIEPHGNNPGVYDIDGEVGYFVGDLIVN